MTEPVEVVTPPVKAQPKARAAKEDPTAKSIFALIPAIRQEVGAVRKDLQATAGARYNYRSADQVINALVPILNKYGVFTTVEDIEHRSHERDLGQRIVTVVNLKKAVTFYAPDGSYVTSTVWTESSDFADKATGSAQTYAYRTALLQTFTLPTDEDDPDSRYVEKTVEAAPAGRAPAGRQASGNAKVDAASAASAESVPGLVREIKVLAGARGLDGAAINAIGADTGVADWANDLDTLKIVRDKVKAKPTKAAAAE